MDFLFPVSCPDISFGYGLIYVERAPWTSGVGPGRRGNATRWSGAVRSDGGIKGGCEDCGGMVRGEQARESVALERSGRHDGDHAVIGGKGSLVLPGVVRPKPWEREYPFFTLLDWEYLPPFLRKGGY